MIHWNLGFAWLAFALVVAAHVADEATHGFLSVYNPNALAMRRRLRLGFFPPVFTLRSFVIALGAAVLLLLGLTPVAFHGVHWLRIAAIPVAILVGLGNGCLHLGDSLLCRRWMPGALTAPLLLAAGSWLLWSAWPG